MQAVRRSNRLRNRHSNVGAPGHPRGSVSEPNLGNMGGDRYNAVNIEHVQIDPDIGDLVPGEQGQGDADLIIDEDFPPIIVNPWITALAVILIIFLTFLLSNLCTSIIMERYLATDRATNSIIGSNKYNFDYSNYCPLKYNARKQINIHKSLRLLKRKLRKLNKGIDAFMEWRGNMTTATSKIKNNHILEYSKQIEQALTLYDADKVGMIDYAMESAGGYISSIPDTIPAPSHLSYAIMGFINVHYPSNPRLLIQPGTLPGQCFAFKGPNGRVRIRLVRRVNITAVTIEHAHRSLVGDMNSAPKDFQVYGLEEADSNSGVELGRFTFSPDKKPLQTFYVQKSGNQKGYEHVELHVLTNQGNSEYTCVYRFRVHGNKIDSPDDGI